MIRRLLALAAFLLLFAPPQTFATVCTCPSTPSDAYGALICSNNPCTYYRMDESSGTAAVDTSQSGNGTYNGGFTLGQTGPITTRTGSKGVLLNGTTGYGTYLDTGNDVPDHGPTTGNGSNWTLIMWVKPASVAFSVLASQFDGSGTNNGWAAYLCTSGACGGSDGYAFWMYNTNALWCGHTASIGSTTNAWHLIMIRTTGNGTTLGSATIWSDDGTATATTTVFNNAGRTCHFGSSQPKQFGASVSSNFFNGSIAELATMSGGNISIGDVYTAATVASGLPNMGRRVFQSRRTVVSPYFLPVSFGVREPQPFSVDDPIFEIDRLNKRAIRSRGVYAH